MGYSGSECSLPLGILKERERDKERNKRKKEKESKKRKKEESDLDLNIKEKGKCFLQFPFHLQTRHRSTKHTLE